jgi:hypothetical protein
VSPVKTAASAVVHPSINEDRPVVVGTYRAKGKRHLIIKGVVVDSHLIEEEDQ